MDIAKLRSALGLPEEADEAAIETALKDLAAQAAKVETLAAQVLDLETKLTEAVKNKKDADPDADPSKGDGVKGPTVEEMRDVRGEVGKLTVRLAERDAETAVSQAIKAGKLLPKQEAWAKAYALKDLEGFATYIADQPVLVDLGVKGSAGGGEGQFNLADYEPTAEERNAAEQMGLWSEDHRKALIRQKAEAAGVKVPAEFAEKKEG